MQGLNKPLPDAFRSAKALCSAWDNELKEFKKSIKKDFKKPSPVNGTPVFHGSAQVQDIPTGNPKITRVFDSLHDLLQYKNAKYGNSATEPIGVFSKATAETGLLQRLDDKIARVKNSPELRKNDVADIMGYLALLCVTKGWDSFDEFKD